MREIQPFFSFNFFFQFNRFSLIFFIIILDIFLGCLEMGMMLRKNFDIQLILIFIKFNLILSI